ncbi:MAG: NAD-dependent deacylase [Chloroflexi bacterium]|nr:NAD-dependent deacylase [Chloroflexota bacterium]MBI2977102.1 NAD-dependent deacylase [Chloroflexota bacterium]MBI5290955.1 NAD-dependent deacylase [Chloroflexota bacterium]
MASIATRHSIGRAADLVRGSPSTVALTGAGISTPSGIPDFRSPESGLWTDIDPTVVATLQEFCRNPKAFYEWIRPLARLLLAAEPNPAHRALARLEQAGRLAVIVTQNIDMLHHRAGSERVLEVHGHLREATCIHCYRAWPAHAFLLRWLDDNVLPRCPECGYPLKPNVILFGEQLPAQILTQAKLAARRCGVMLVAGSSLEVFPAADLPLIALEHGAKLIVINHMSTFVDDRAEVVIRDDVAEVLPALADEVLRAGL